MIMSIRIFRFNMAMFFMVTQRATEEAQSFTENLCIRITSVGLDQSFPIVHRSSYIVILKLQGTRILLRFLMQRFVGENTNKGNIFFNHQGHKFSYRIRDWVTVVGLVH